MSAEMQQVDAVIRERLASEVALIDQISRYIVGAGGKRIRPRLVLLFAERARVSTGPSATNSRRSSSSSTPPRCCTTTWSTSRRCAAAAQTANALFGNAASVLVGDFLYSRAFQMMVSVDRMRVLEVLADATNVIAEGEVLQLMNMHDPDLAVDDYLRVIRFKTAKLFEASARLGAVLAGATPRAGRGLRRLRPLAGHGVPAGRRPARLRRRQRRAGQERRRRPARRQAHVAAAGGDGARHGEPSAR